MAVKTNLSRAEVRRVFVTSQYTTNFRHLLPVYKGHINKDSVFDKVPKTVPTSDRIKWWNIVPGDQIRVMAEENGRVREVKGINKLSNRVYVEGDNKRKNTSQNDFRSMIRHQNPHKNVHYSGVQLYLGHYSFPPAPGSSTKQNLPVFALRLGTSEPRWENGHWVWDRFATATSPRLPTWEPGVQEKIPIPWPEPNKPQLPEPTRNDTAQSVVAEVTYVPSRLYRKCITETAQPSRVGEDDYIRMLRHEVPYSQRYPMEISIARELSNPHSRVKKRLRYLAARTRERELLKQYVQAEVAKKIPGRSKREAVAEATFKWREKLRLDRKVELKKRWVQRGLKARLERKRERAGKKLEREKRKLNELILKEAPNQVVPKAR